VPFLNEHSTRVDHRPSSKKQLLDADHLLKVRLFDIFMIRENAMSVIKNPVAVIHIISARLALGESSCGHLACSGLLEKTRETMCQVTVGPGPIWKATVNDRLSSEKAIQGYLHITSGF
jgi:hypothetical protein